MNWLNFYLLITGRDACLPSLPSIPGDEGVGEVVEIGEKVVKIVPGDRVILITRMQGTWRYYGIFHEQSLFKISPKLALPEAATLCISPSTAYRMLEDFRVLHKGETVILNAANSPIGQCIIQLCKIKGLKTLNIVANHCNYEETKEYLMKLGATKVCTLEEAEELTSFDTYLTRPVLAFNCLGGRYEDVLLKLLDWYGTIVYYGFAYDLPKAKQCMRTDVSFCAFHYGLWSSWADPLDKWKMFTRLSQYMVIGQLRAPKHNSIELKDFMYALRNTFYYEAFTTENQIFDLTLP